MFKAGRDTSKSSRKIRGSMNTSTNIQDLAAKVPSCSSPTVQPVSPAERAITLPSPTKTSRRGFTMIELIVVIAVVTLIAGLVAPKVVAMHDGQISRNFLTAVRSLAVQARSEAINREVTMAITFDSSNNQ